jgi:hypothetical protein
VQKKKGIRKRVNLEGKEARNQSRSSNKARLKGRKEGKKPNRTRILTEVRQGGRKEIHERRRKEVGMRGQRKQRRENKPQRWVEGRMGGGKRMTSTIGRSSVRSHCERVSISGHM